MREDAGLSVRALAQRADLAASTVHRVERGALRPTVETLERIATSTGHALVVEAPPESSKSLLGLGLAIADDLRGDEPDHIVRRAAELASRFAAADRAQRAWMLAVAPPSTGSPEWDAFLGGLAEWLAVTHDLPTPTWAGAPDRFLGRGWWVTDLPSLRAWEFAGTPVSLQRRGVYLHRDSLVNV